ncbi:MAG: dephospho-CoA kinase [Desulfosalsimonadaceae bacterium]
MTGGIGSGKSLVCRRLAEKGLVVVSTDELSRLAVSPGTEAHAKIAEHFGNRVLMEDQSVNRPELRRIISADPEAKKALEGFVHPEVLRQMVEIIEDASKKGEPLVVVEVPLLFESGFDAWFDRVILVSVSLERRIARIMSRDGVTREEALAMMKIQMPEHEKRKRADFVIDNNGPETDTLLSVDRLYEQLIA